MLRLCIENISGEPLSLFDRAVNAAQSQCVMCAICLCWIQGQEAVSVPLLTTEHNSLHVLMPSLRAQPHYGQSVVLLATREASDKRLVPKGLKEAGLHPYDNHSHLS